MKLTFSFFQTMALLVVVLPIILSSLSYGAGGPELKGNSYEIALRYFSPQEIRHGREYHRGRYAALFLSFAIQALIILLALKLRWFRHIRDVSGMLSGGRWQLEVAIFASLFLLILSMATFPIRLYLGYLHEHAYGLSNQSLRDWLVDDVKANALGFVMLLPLAVLLYFFIRRFPNWWWAVDALCAAALIVIFVHLSPVLIEPIFFKCSQIKDQEIVDRFRELASKAGIRTSGVFKINASHKTRKVNAYFTGLGNTKRIVVYDNLLSDFTPEESEVVLAHEIGHWKEHHIWKSILISSVGTFLTLFLMATMLKSAVVRGTFGIRSIADPLGLPFMLLIFISLNFLTLPIQNAISRHFEREADMASLELTDDPGTFIEVERKLGRINLADVVPPLPVKLFLYTHPPVLERIRMAEDYMVTRNGGKP